MRPRVPLQVKGIVKSLAAERAEVSLNIGMAFHMSIEQTLQRETLVAHPAAEVRLAVFSRYGSHFNLVVRPRSLPYGLLVGQRILDPVAAVHELQLHLGRKTQLQQEVIFTTCCDVQESRHFDLGTAFFIEYPN